MKTAETIANEILHKLNFEKHKSTTQIVVEGLEEYANQFKPSDEVDSYDLNEVDNWEIGQPQTKEVDWDEIRNIISDNMDRLGIAMLNPANDVDCSEYVNKTFEEIKQKLNK